MGAETRVGIVVELDDKASAGLKSLGATGDEAMSKLGTASDSADLKLGKIPKMMTKSSAAMAMLGGSSTEMGAGVEKAIGKLSSLGMLLSSGGPVGIAIAGATGAIAAASFVWSVYKQESVSTENALTSLKRVMDSITEAGIRQAEQTGALANEFRFVGMTARQRAQAEREEAMVLTGVSIPAMEKEIQGEEAALAARQALVEKEREQVEALHGEGTALSGKWQETQKGIDADKSFLDIRKRNLEESKKHREDMGMEIAIIKDTIGAEKELADAIKAKTAAEKADADQLAADRAEIKAWEDGEQRLADKHRARVEARGQAFVEDLGKQAKLLERKAELEESLAREQDKRLTEQQQEYEAIAKTLGKQVISSVISLIKHEKDLKQVVMEGAQMAGQAAVNAAMDFAIAAGVKKALSLTEATTYVMTSKAKTATAVTGAAAEILAQTGVAAAQGAASFAPIVPAMIAGGEASAAAVQGTATPYLAAAGAMAVGGEKGGRIRGKPGDFNILRAADMERVLTVDQTKSFEKLVEILGKRGSQKAASSGSVNVTVINKNTVEPSTADTKRNAVQIGKLLKRQSRLGYGRA